MHLQIIWHQLMCHYLNSAILRHFTLCMCKGMHTCGVVGKSVKCGGRECEVWWESMKCGGRA